MAVLGCLCSGACRGSLAAPAGPALALEGTPSAPVSAAAAPLAGAGERRAHPGVPGAPLVSEPIQLRFIDDFNVSTPPFDEAAARAPAARWDGAVRGLSGLYYSAAEGLLYAVSDDPRHFPPRFYTFGVELSQTELRLMPRSVVLLHERVPSARLVDIDCEAVTADGRGGLLLATEGAEDRPTQPAASILRLSRAGLIMGQLPIPPAYVPEPRAAPTRGMRSNLGFEGLSLSPSGRWLWASAESALIQDGPPASFERGTKVRFLRWDLATGEPPAEFWYPIEPVTPRPAGEARAAHNGVSEIVAVDDQRLLVLERAWVAFGTRGKNDVRVFQVVVDTAPAEPPTAEPPTAEPPTAEPLTAEPPTAEPRWLHKRLVLDLDDVLAQLEPGQQHLDNFEGMTLGPPLPSGEPSLLLVTDDNFSDEQRTVFLAFALHGGSSRTPLPELAPARTETPR